MRIVWISKAAALAILLFGSLASPARADVSCHVINAQGAGQDDGQLHTTGDVIGGGLLQGTIAGNITPTGGSFPVFTFSENVKFTTQHGELTVLVTGTIDISALTSGRFSASGPVTAATGKLAGATGVISFSGVVKFSAGPFSAGVFAEDINGVVCVDLKP